MEKETQERVLNFRVTAKLYEKLAALATKDKRTVSAYIRVLLEDHVERPKATAKDA